MRYHYANVAPYCGQYAEICLTNGKTYRGQIVEVGPEGMLFHSSNPGFLFIPFLALWALTLPLAYGAGLYAGQGVR